MSGLLIRCLVAALALFLMPPAYAQAEDIPGEDDSRFNVARDQWLAGEDLAALMQFSELARDGNPAAQLFLGVIEQKLWLHGHITADMPRLERIALLRQTGGLSGKTWLNAAASVPLAADLLQARRRYVSPSLAFALANAGEVAAALEQRRQAVFFGDPVGGLEIALHPQMLSRSRGAIRRVILGLAYYGPQDFDRNDPRLPAINEALLDVPPENLADALFWKPRTGDFQNFFERIDATADTLRSEGLLLADHPDLAPLIRVLRDRCADSYAFELGVLLFFLLDESIFYFALSPLDSLVPGEIYFESARYPADVARQARFTLHEGLHERYFPCLTTLDKAS